MPAGTGCRLTALAALAVMAALAIAACGDDGGETTTVTEPAAGETTPAETETTAEGAGPSGVLTTDGVGEVEEGMSADEVRGYFGDPATEEVLPGCELAGPNAPKVLIWTYQLDDGELSLTFDEPGTALASYRTDSPGFETERGDRVGDFFTAVQDRWGGRLEPVPLGEVTEKLGFWWVQDGPTRALLFDIRGGTVAGIQGGDIQFCE